MNYESSDGLDKGTKFTFWIPKTCDTVRQNQDKIAKRAKSLLTKPIVLAGQQHGPTRLKDLKSSGSDEHLPVKQPPDTVTRHAVFLVEDNPVNQMIIK